MLTSLASIGTHGVPMNNRIRILREIQLIVWKKVETLMPFKSLIRDRKWIQMDEIRLLEGVIHSKKISHQAIK